jgi:flagellar L-ring protein precursor FlgH
MKRLATIIFLAFVATACAPAKKTPEPAPVLTPPPSQPLVTSENPGSIFDPGQASLLYEDTRARRVGDIVMVHVVENSSGKHKADTKSEKDSSIQLGVENYFGQSNLNVFPFGMASGSTGTTPILKAGSKSGLTATGETKRESDLSAVVGARVVRVLPNGVMQVEGAREMRINEETQILVVRGLIRPQDIQPDNTITSNYLANAKIEYFGQGVLADKQRPGWLTRILDNVWPF